MLGILGGVQDVSYDALVDQIHSIFEPDMDICLHLYGKIPKPRRKIGYITVTFLSSNINLEQLAASLIKGVDSIRQARLDIKSVQLCPSAVPAVQPTTSSPALSRNITNPLGRG